MASPARGGRCRVAKVGRRETRVLVLRLDLGDVEGVARRAREFLRFNRARAAQKELSCAAPRCAASIGALVFCTSAPSLHTLSHTAAEVARLRVQRFGFRSNYFSVSLCIDCGLAVECDLHLSLIATD